MSTDTYVRSENLIELDESVWNIRSYCRYVRATVKDGSVDLTDHYVENINSRNSLKRSQNVPAARWQWFSPRSARTASDRSAPPRSGLA